MDPVKELRGKLQKPKDNKNPSLQPTAPALSSLGKASLSIAALQVVDQDSASENRGVSRAGTPRSQPSTINDERRAAHWSTRVSKRDKLLPRVALMLNLIKSIADAAEFAPLKGACEAVATLLDSIQVRFNELSHRGTDMV